MKRDLNFYFTNNFGYKTRVLKLETVIINGVFLFQLHNFVIFYRFDSNIALLFKSVLQLCIQVKNIDNQTKGTVKSQNPKDMTGAACGTGNAYPFGAPAFTSGFHRGSCCPVICVSLFHVIVLSFRFWVLIVPFVWLLDIYIFNLC